MKNREFDVITWDEIRLGTFIEGKQIPDDIMQSLDDDIESIMRELDS